MKGRGTVTALVLGLALVAPAAHAVPGLAPVTPRPPVAVPGAPASPAQLAEARLHFQQGVALFREQNYDAALAEFRGAYAISGEPVVLYNLGLTEKALFHYAEAVDALDRYLAESAAHGQAVAKARKAEVEKIVAEMKSLLADVTLIVRPPQATVVVDGRAVTLGIEGIVKLAAGSHVVEASAPDHVAEKRPITVVAGTPQTVDLALAPVPRTGRARVQATELGARVAVDGKDLGPAPVELELLAGGHTVEVSSPGFVLGRLELVVAVGQSRTVTVTLERPREAGAPTFVRRWWFWAGLGVVAAATTATILLWPASSEGPIPGSLGTTHTDF